MLIGIIADTHDHVDHIQEAVRLFKQREVDLVIHAGDYCSPFTIPLFRDLPLRGILGNNDGDLYLLMNKFSEIGADLEGEFFKLRTGDRSIAVYHGTYPEITDALYKCGNYDVVITGHTHETLNELKGNTLAINPGTANGFGDKATVALLETTSLEVEFVEL